MDLVGSKDQITSNLLVFDSYRTSKATKHRLYFSERLRFGANFVVALIGNRLSLCPSRFVGYAECTMEKHLAFPFKDGKETTPQISKLLGLPTSNDKAEKAYQSLCKELGVTPTKKKRTYWSLVLPKGTKEIPPSDGQTGYPDEVDVFIEGASKRVIVNAYERDERARQACIGHFGSSCCICKFDFGTAYGEIGNGFIHVHHLVPLAHRGGEYQVNPVSDLRPVCPNCHAMLHTSAPPFSIEELQEIIKSQKSASKVKRLRKQNT